MMRKAWPSPCLKFTARARWPVPPTSGYGEGVAALDGEDQWTCTPGSIAEVPARDELYSRIDDIDQLNNVASKHPEVAAELLRKLRLFMSELRAS